MEKGDGIMLMNDPDYVDFVQQIRMEIGHARARTRLVVVREGVLHYWRLGAMINQHNEWGHAFIENLARDIRAAYPNATGYSERNLHYMARFAAAYPDLEVLQQPIAELPWGHNITLMSKVSNPAERLWYAEQALANGWSRSVLTLQIESRLHQRQVETPKVNNFGSHLPPPQSDLATQMLKDPYIFDFIDSEGVMNERDIERQMVSHIGRLLLELGTGFAFIKEQYHIEVGGQDFYIDLLFYHLKLRCYILIELKSTDFKPEYAGQISFYVTAVDELLRHQTDAPTIGILLCQGKTGLVADYALRGVNKPIGVAEYHLVRELPDELAELLPSAEDISSRIDIASEPKEQE